jgi:hypothetical protein
LKATAVKLISRQQFKGCPKAGPIKNNKKKRGGDEKGSRESDLDPRMTALARISSIYKRQTRPLVREGAPDKRRP